MNWKLWIAQGFGIGRIPVAPGTFGSIVGIGFLALLLCSHSWWIVAGGSVFAIPVSIWLCGEGEKILGKRDPGSVVLDEIVAMPVSFAMPMFWWFNSFQPPSVHMLNPFNVVISFAFFRLFDIWKPWPVRQSQNLPGGWGVTIDDLLAAVYVNIVWLIIGFVVSVSFPVPK